MRQLRSADAAGCCRGKLVWRTRLRSGRTGTAAAAKPSAQPAAEPIPATKPASSASTAAKPTTAEPATPKSAASAFCGLLRWLLYSAWQLLWESRILQLLRKQRQFVLVCATGGSWILQLHQLAAI